ncbi:BTAD domain-containing putative transcriptional regulator [Streptomyces sp. HNM0645]|uniref:ATP-binding protein n=1 Tax=Streptomyces sp. HNM0645 TaxID=2782343 RepID=UPI0024B6DB01|nr:BTAD domain-containing putative transcriptional regulator [Streptomyces sp. HNM0645]MDI9884680.1 BTAD domain-containing putative transcriptional regulator [Streptomyces sp. HNM0645]
MQYRVLGPTQAFHDDGTPVALGGARLRALLTALALRTGRTVPVGVLIGDIWYGDPPADAVGAVQALVGRLRRALGPAAVAAGDGRGYQLRAQRDEVDLHRFDRLAGEGTRAMADGDALSAAALLDEALGLWRGPVLADLPGRLAEAARWETRRLDAQRTRLTAVLAIGGRAEEALAELAESCAAHPLDERLQELRIAALRDTGRTAQALAAYEEVRRVLADRLGTDPGPGLRALHKELLRPYPYEAGGTSPAASPSADASPGTPPPGNLRTRLNSFVGREPDLRAIREDLAGARFVTLVGAGGSGKTRLSQEAAERAAADPDRPWPDGVWLAELAPVEDPESVPETVLSALGGRETVLRGAGAEELRAGGERQSGDAFARLVEYCARRRMLLLLDNCEHVVEAAAALAERLLERCPGLTVLATSREPLGVPGELVRPVGPLPIPVALRLLADRGAAARPDFRIDVDEATASACAEICRRLDGLPLAVELAAARLRMLTAPQIADRLDDRFRLLNTGARTVLPRQQTLRAVVDWSWDLLDLPERAVLRRLSVFAGECDIAAAESVCADPADRTRERPAEPDVATLLGALVDKSLVVAAPGADGEMRYRLLETVAEYAGERLDEAAEREAAERRHLVHYRELARNLEPRLRGAGQRATLARLQLEHENLRTALRHAVAARDEHEGLSLVLSLAWYWQLRDLRGEARHWTDAVSALGPDPFAHPVVPAPPLTERCTDAPPPLRGELLTEARRQVRLVRMVNMDHAIEEWLTPERRRWLDRVTEAYHPGLPQACRFPASLWFFAVLISGDGERVLEVLDTTIRTAEEAGCDWELAAALQVRANALANRTLWAGDARRDADRSLKIFERLGDAWGAAEALSARGEAHERSGAYEEAAEDFRRAIERADVLGAQSQVSLLQARLAAVLDETGRGAEAEKILREVLAAGPESGYEGVIAARLILALRVARTGRTAEARGHLMALLDDFRTETLAVFEGLAHGALGCVDVLDGEFEDALARCRRALQLGCTPLSMMVSPQLSASQLLTAARALIGLGGQDRALRAARLVGAHEGLLPPGHFLSSFERENRRLAEESARAVLGDTAFEAARVEGGGLGLEEAAALL